jgi:drug/metabolite transporter (DMT)-like permease
VSSAKQGFFAIIAAACLWGVSGAVAKWAFTATAIPPLFLIQIRMGLSSLLLFLWFGLTNRALLRFPRSEARFLVIWGIIGLAMVQFTYLATLSLTNVSTAVFLQYLSPITTALWGWVSGSERLNSRLLLSLGLASIGSGMLLFSGEGLRVSLPGLLMGLSSAVFMTFNSVVGGRGAKRQSPWGMLAWGMAVGFLFWLVVDLLLWLVGRPLQGLSMLGQSTLWPYFIYLALLATIIPFGLYMSGLRSVPPTGATMTAMLEPVVASLGAFLLLGEAMSLLEMLGGGLILLAVVMLQVRRSDPAQASAPASAQAEASGRAADPAN